MQNIEMAQDGAIFPALAPSFPLFMGRASWDGMVSAISEAVVHKKNACPLLLQ